MIFKIFKSVFNGRGRIEYRRITRRTFRIEKTFFWMDHFCLSLHYCTSFRRYLQKKETIRTVSRNGWIPDIKVIGSTHKRDVLNQINYLVPLRWKKQGGLRNTFVLLGVTPLWHVDQWVSRAPSHHTLPDFLNLNGYKFYSDKISLISWFR